MADIELVIKIPEEDLEWIEKQAEKLNISKADVICRCISGMKLYSTTFIEKSEDIISEDITKAGSQIEMLVDGTWIKGTVVEGYRYQDGIVTIETADGHRYWCGQDRTDIYRRIKEN